MLTLWLEMFQLPCCLQVRGLHVTEEAFCKSPFQFHLSSSQPLLPLSSLGILSTEEAVMFLFFWPLHMLFPLPQILVAIIILHWHPTPQTRMYTWQPQHLSHSTSRSQIILPNFLRSLPWHSPQLFECSSLKQPLLTSFPSSFLVCVYIYTHFYIIIIFLSAFPK